MATISFSESFKYGSRLFGFFLSILVVGGGLVGAGAYLAVPEIQGWLDTGSAETSLIAGGVVAGVVGTAVLSIGQFAILYKLIADGVARGNADPAVDVAATPVAEETADEQEAEESPVEQEAAVTEPAEQPPERKQPREPAVDNGPQPEPDPPREPAQATPPEQSQEAEATVEAETGREQTAEEIVFGSSDDSTAAESQEDTGEFEFEDESESHEDVETAGNPSSDPLADNFDDE